MTASKNSEAALRITFEGGTLLVHGEPSACELPEGFVRDDRARGAWRGPASAYRSLMTILARAGEPFDDQARTYERLPLVLDRPYEPRGYQAEALAAWRGAGGRGVVVLPTGAGKTFVAELAIAAVGRAALIVTPTIDLMQQWYTGLGEAFDREIGLLGGGYHEPRPITVTTYDSAYLHMDRLGNRFGLVVFDEAHHLPGASYAQAASSCIAPYRLGLTATPERADGGEDQFPQLVGPIVFRKHIKEMAGIHLASYDAVQVEVELDDQERDTYNRARATYLGFVRINNIRMGGAGGWQRFLRESSRSRDGRVALMAYREQRRVALSCRAKFEKLAALLAEHRDDRVIVFTNDNDSVYAISRRFLIPALTHQTPVKERKLVLERFNGGAYPAIVTSRVLNEGVNVPDANVAIVLSGTGSVREHVQRLGRILRQQKDKRALLYEIVARETNEEFVSERRREHEAYR